MSENQWNFYIAGDLDVHYVHNIDTSNTVDGKLMYYVVDIVDEVYDSSTNAGAFYAINCENIVIKDLILANNWFGIFLYNTNNSTIENITITNNAHGMVLRNSSNNYIYNNNFIENMSGQAIVQGGSGNVFSLSAPIGGNYWSHLPKWDIDGDGFRDYPYVFNGGQDNLPLTYPFGFNAIGATPVGDDVFSDLVDPETSESLASLTFSDVTREGISTLTTTTPAENQGPPEGFKVGQPPTIFNISTTAVYEGPIEISINYSGVSFQNESTLKLFHYENDAWVDVTTYVDTANDIINGVITSFSAFAIFELDNQPPEVTITSPASGFVCPVNVPVDFVADIHDPDIDDTHLAQWTISSENMTGVFEGTVEDSTVSNSFTFIEAGIYSIELMVTDAEGEMDVANTVNDDADFPAFIVVYDPDGGFVTGGGWIDSPAGALLDSTAEGKANFGFVSKYKKGKIVPEGNTEFRFNAGDFRFKSSSYEWLIVAGTKAMFKGEGFITDMDGDFKFMLTAVDSDEDKFRIRIWDPLTDEVIYDNKRGQDDDAEPTTIGGGSIVIHKN